MELFIPLTYPAECPKLFVRPTPNMTVKANHRHVDMQGVVYLPYLHEWKPSSHLRGLVEVASGVFSIDPPLFARPATPTPAPTPYAYAPTPTPVVQPQQQQVQQPVQQAVYTANAARPAVYTPSYPTSKPADPVTVTSVTSVAAMSSASHANTPDPLKRLNLIEEVSMKLQAAIHKKHLTQRDELCNEMEVQSYLSESAQRALADVRDKERLIQTLEAALGEVSEKMIKCSQKASEHVTPDPVTLIQADELSNQIMTLFASIAAIDDVFYHLDKMLGKLDVNTYLKEVRALSRQQFLYKLHLQKISRTLQTPVPPQQQYNAQYNVNVAGGRYQPPTATAMAYPSF